MKAIKQFIKKRKMERILNKFTQSFGLKNNKEIDYSIINELNDLEILDYLSNKIASFQCIWLQDIKGFKLDFIKKLYEKGFKIHGYPNSTFFFFQPKAPDNLEKIKFITQQEGLERVISKKSDYRYPWIQQDINLFMQSCYFYLKENNFKCEIYASPKDCIARKYQSIELLSKEEQIKLKQEVHAQIQTVELLFELDLNKTKWYKFIKNEAIKNAIYSETSMYEKSAMAFLMSKPILVNPHIPNNDLLNDLLMQNLELVNIVEREILSKQLKRQVILSNSQSGEQVEKQNKSKIIL